jgi:hypothetical protein
VGFILLGFFWPQGSGAMIGWILVGVGALLAAAGLSIHFGKVRAKTP